MPEMNFNTRKWVKPEDLNPNEETQKQIESSDPMYTIRVSTYWLSVAMGVDKNYGTISEGKYADIIAVKGDVLRYIDLLQNVDMVFKHGKRYK